MSDQAAPTLPLQTSRKLLAERRTSLRFPCDLRAVCLLDKREDEWPAKVRNISAKGIGLMLTRLFPHGTVFKIRVSLPDRTFLVQARAVFSHFEGEAGWYHGCVFLQSLSMEEVELLLR